MLQFLKIFPTFVTLSVLGVLLTSHGQAQAGGGIGLIEEFQCGRCHELPEKFTAYSRRHSCVACHIAILDGELDGTSSPEILRHWKTNIGSLVISPSLANMSRRLKRGWIEGYLLSPYVVRAHLGASMPRLKLTKKEASAIASELSSLMEESKENEQKGDSERGAELIKEKGCLACHGSADRSTLSNAIRLAPDLGHTKERMTQASVREWLTNPQAVLKGTLMPNPNLSEAEIVDIVSALWSYPSHHHMKDIGALPAILPLERRVTYKEIDQRVFKKVCRHCHSKPIVGFGDGGPGNTGGFGYSGVGLDLSDEAGLRAGVLDRKTGKRRSVISSESKLLPKIVEVLLARHVEMQGQYVAGTLGMPLGFAPIALGDVQLLLTWCLQETKTPRRSIKAP